MENEKSKQPWWQTIPAILTGIAGLIGAFTALIVALDGQEPPLPRAKDEEAPHKQSVIAGKWIAPDFTSDDEKVIHLNDGNGEITGFYNTKDDARIIRGVLSGRQLTAYWVENSAAKKCTTQLDNRYYWGKVKITFDEGFKTFDGWWGYCNQEPKEYFVGKKSG